MKPFPICLKKGKLISDKGTEAIRQLCQKNRCVISCGGGVVTRKENMALLKKAGTIFFLDRDVEAIIASVDTSTRPLLEEDAEKVRDLDQKTAPSL